MANNVINLTNLTPHDVKIIIGEKTIIIPKDGRQVRAAEHVSNHGSLVIDGTPVPIKGKLMGSPILTDEAGTELGDLNTIRAIGTEVDMIVSLAAAKAIKAVDPDLACSVYVPNDLVREDGVIKGCASLVCAAFLE